MSFLDTLSHKHFESQINVILNDLIRGVELHFFADPNLVQFLHLQF